MKLGKGWKQVGMFPTLSYSFFISKNVSYNIKTKRFYNHKTKGFVKNRIGKYLATKNEINIEKEIKKLKNEIRKREREEKKDFYNLDKIDLSRIENMIEGEY